jgi:hypothetical protein
VDDFVNDVKDLVNVISELLSISIDEKMSNIKALSDKFLQEAKSELPDTLYAKIDQAYDKLLDAKTQYDSLTTALQDCTEPPVCDGIKEGIEQAKHSFEEAKNDIKNLESAKDSFYTVYGSIIRDALKAIVQESTDSLPAVTQSRSTNAQTLGFDLASTNILKDSLINFESDSLDDMSLDIGQVLTTTLQQQYEQYYTTERKLNKTKLAKFFSENMDTDKGAEKLGKELVKDAKKLSNYIYDSLKANVARPDIVNQVKLVIYDRITKIYFEQIK